MAFMNMKTAATVCCFVLASNVAHAACLDDPAADALGQALLDGMLAPTPGVETLEEGYCTQAKVVEWMSPVLGGVAGYKAGLTSAPAQERFGVEQPVSGVLLHGMLLQDGAMVPTPYGARPVFEADLVVTVSDSAINQAMTPDDVLKSLSDVRPFIELPDLVVENPSTLQGPQIAAINVGAKLGVLGAAVPVEQTPEFLTALSDMTVTMTDQNGNELSSAPGSIVLGHPLNAVLFLIDRGVELRPGDIVSVGSIGPLLPPQSGLTVTATYEGLPGTPTVSVTFQ